MKNKYRKLIIITILLLVIVNFVVYFSALKSEAYAVAVNQVKEEYGGNVNYHLHYLGYNIKTDSNRGYADFVIIINEGSTPYKAYVSLVQNNGTWSVIGLEKKAH